MSNYPIFKIILCIIILAAVVFATGMGALFLGLLGHQFYPILFLISGAILMFLIPVSIFNIYQYETLRKMWFVFFLSILISCAVHEMIKKPVSDHLRERKELYQEE